ncbi:MAG TPA: YbaB/EbfC family nucleoid-associated protein [Candidatus Krumholzibacteriaceae bacterium]|nr:YbaB/EbfC family nucleoid-associated protein [Candidatus Krumholzibacteriaceae bacterium]
MKDMGKFLKQAQQVQQKIARIQEELSDEVVEATAGGGMVKVAMNGSHEVVSISIDPEVVDPEDIEMLEELIVAAVNEARSEVEDMIKQRMGSITGGISIPGLF